MTLAPLVNPTVHGVKGKPVEFGSSECSTPGCHRQAQQRHHLWPKSYLRGQPYEWVSVNGVVLANSVGLCMGHHDDVTSPVGGHRAHIRYDEALEVFEWWTTDSGSSLVAPGEWFCLGLLDQNSPLVRETEAERERPKEGLCPSCGRPSREKPKGLPKRKAKSWTVSVPDDAEDGAAVLDEYIDDLSVALGFGDEAKGLRRFHVLANVLLWVTQMKPEFLADWEDANAA